MRHVVSQPPRDAQDVKLNGTVQGKITVTPGFISESSLRAHCSVTIQGGEGEALDAGQLTRMGG